MMPITERDKNIIERRRRITNKIRASPYHIKETTKEPDIVRWSDYIKPKDSNFEALEARLASSAGYMPPELTERGTGRKSAGAKRTRGLSLNDQELAELAEIERKGGSGGDKAGGSARPRGASVTEETDIAEAEEPDEGFDQDYLVDHYDSAGDDGDDDGGGDEAFF